MMSFFKSFYIFCFLFSLTLLAKEKQDGGFYISHIKFDSNKKLDPFTLEQLRKIQGQYKNREQLKSYINETLLGIGLRNITYKLTDGDLYFSFDTLPRIKKVMTKGSIPGEINITPYLINKNEYLQSYKINESIKNIRGLLRVHGYPHSKVVVSRMNKELTYNIKVGEPLLIKNVKVFGGDPFLNQHYQMMLNEFVNKPKELSRFSQKKDKLDKAMRDFGYTALQSKLISGQQDEYTVKLTYQGPYIFHFSGNKHFSYYELKKTVREQAKFVDITTSENIISAIIESHYKQSGYYHPEITVKRQKYKKNKKGQELTRFNIKIDEGERLPIKKVQFKGNNKIDKEQLLKVFRNHSSSLTKGKYYDEDNLRRIPDFYRRYYMEHGFLSENTRVRIPYIQSDKPSENTIDFIFNEGNRTIIDEYYVRDIYGENIDLEFINKLKASYRQQPFNPFKIETDIENIEKNIQNLGYLKAQVVNKNQKALVQFSNDRSLARVNIIVERGQKYILGDIHIFGNLKTKDKLIHKHINPTNEKLITPLNIDRFKKHLFSLGLFQSVKLEIKPQLRANLIDGDEIIADIIIRVKEKDYGRIELSPGLRTDTGVKLGFNIGYSNLGGMGRSLRWSSEISQRLRYSVFDPTRNAQDNKFPEYAFDLSFTEIDFLKTNINYLAQLGARRRRFFAFDARVARIANTMNYLFPDSNFSLSLGHQYESIKQENASDNNDNGEFKIGSLVPKIAFDWRDNIANPIYGALHQLDIEWADRLWLSQDINGERVSFTKYVLRNRFYIPFKKGTIAFGWTAGIQQNASKSLIPGIKIFRLTGVDQVRGFSDDEINRLSSGEDISQGQVSKNAYLNSLKVEPRFFINDNLMIGAFWDAGRVTTDEAQFFNLKQSVGLSIRFLTPVGSINLDYGRKLNPETFSDGSVESPGRFHLSIGLF